MIYDINTKNMSFLKMSYELKKHNVQNNKFMLALFDEDLVGVDPYSENLSPILKAKIYAEVCRNYWYFLREVAKVPQEGNSQGIMFQLNLGNMAAAYCGKNNISHILVLPRQQGKTVVEVMLSLWVFEFSGTFINETYLHKNQAGSVDNLSRFKKFRELLPTWLTTLTSDYQDKDNLEEKFSQKRKNRIQALSSAANDMAADKLGRGSSTAMVYMDEFAFLERNSIVMNALIPAWSTSARVAKENNSSYGIRITTTPNNLSLPQAQYCYKLIQEACRFSYNIYDIPESELQDYVSKNSDNDYVYVYYSWQELGLTKEWYVAQLRRTDALNVRRELDCVWPEADEGNIFTVDQLEKIKHYLKPIVMSLNVHGYAINFYERPDFTMNYIFSCDVSGGLTLDRSVILIISPEDFHVVGLFVNARIDTEDFKQLIKTLLTDYFTHGILNIENNSYGLNIIDSLMRNPIVEPRMIRETLEKLGEKTLTDGTVQKKKSKKVVYGTNTNSQTRKLMFEMLPSIVDEEPEIFVSEDFYSEIKNLIRNKHNKIEARIGFHDDIIMSYLITRYALAYGSCFKNMFHIAPIPTRANIHNGDGAGNTMLSNFGNIIDSANNLNQFSSDDSALQMVNQQINSDIQNGWISQEDQKKSKELMLFDMISQLNNM